MAAALTYFRGHLVCLGMSNNAELSLFRTVKSVVEVHKVNVVGPLMVTQAMLPLLRKGNKKLVSSFPTYDARLLTALMQSMGHTIACRAS